VGDISATVQTKADATVVGDLSDTLSATWGVKVQINAAGQAVMTGMSMGASVGADGTSRSDFLIRADTIGFLNTVNGQVQSPFIFDVPNDTAFLRNTFIQNASIDSAKVKNSAITSAKIKNGAITSAKIADAAITSAKIGDAEITKAKIGDAQIDTLKIADHSVTIHAHVEADAGSYYTGHELACVLNLPAAASLSIFVKFGQNNSAKGSSYTLSINDTPIKNFWPLVFDTVVGYTTGMDQNPVRGMIMVNDTGIAKVEVGAGSQTVKLGGNMQHFHGRSMLVLASMR